MSTFIDDVEEIVDIVGEWAEEYVKLVIDALAPDGRPFWTQAQSLEDQQRDYSTIKGSPDRWYQYVDTMAKTLIEKLQHSGLSPEKIAAVHPYDIAWRRAIMYSVEMESGNAIST